MNLLASSSPLDHVVQHPFIQWDVTLPLLGPQKITVLSDQIIMQIIAGLLTLVVCIIASRRYRVAEGVGQKLIPHGSGNFIEVICEYLRKNVAAPSLGVYTDIFMPYLWTVFFFIWFTNMIGLIPTEPLTRLFLKDSHLTHGHGIGGTATGNVWVTATLAVCTFLMIVINGLRLQGMNFVKHFFQGPFPISVLIAFLEVIGLLAKTFALTMRLFANMVAGHVLLAVLLSFIALSAAAMGNTVGFTIGVMVVLASVAINCLELFVALLQAFIFTFLTAMFIGQAVNIHHDHEHDHDHEHGHGGHHEESHGHSPAH